LPPRCKDARDALFMEKLDQLSARPCLDLVGYGKLFELKGALLSGDISPSYSMLKDDLVEQVIGLFKIGFNIFLGAVLLGSSARAEVSFNRDIRPIMSDTCFRCHGPDRNSRMADLRLDLRDAALKPTQSGKIPIIPGKPSRVIGRAAVPRPLRATRSALVSRPASLCPSRTTVCCLRI